MRLLTLVSILLVSITQVQAQVDLLFGTLTDVQQGLALNPARSQRYKLSIGLPGGAGDYYNGAFRLGAFRTDEPLRTQIQNAVSDLRPGQRLAMESRLDVFGLSAKLPTGHFTLSLAQRIQLYSETPREGIRYLYSGDAFGMSEGVEISDQRSTGIAYAELALGYQRELDNGLRLGGRIRLLHGQLHGKVIDGQITTNRTDTATTIVAIGLLRSSGVVGEDSGDESELTAGSILGGPFNPGVGIDLGLVYESGDGWKYSLSVLDLGMIRFRHETQDFELNGRLSTPGLGQLSQPEDQLNEVVDTLAQIFEDIKADDFQETVSYIDPYTQVLFPRILASGEYAVSPVLGIGVSYGGRLRPKGLSSSGMLYARGRVGSWLQATLGYGLRNNAYSMLGAGFEMRFGPVQLYASSDNFLDLILLDRLESSSARA